MKKDTDRVYLDKLGAAGHRLVKKEDGSVDIFRLDYDRHNGPECELCGKK